jgi:[acyl-carrier-protein] S-malonyltransferase
MAMDFVDLYPEANAVFDVARKVLPFDIEAICRDEDPRLHLTEFTQPCILAAEIANFETLRVQYGLAPKCFAGHSLGEYAALVAAEALPLATALRLVHLRGQLMQRAVPVGQGAMAAVISETLPLDEIRHLAQTQDVDIANDNSSSQVVLSGEASALDRVIRALMPFESQGMRVVPLVVSAPFHSRLMKSIEAEYRSALEACRSDIQASRAKQVLSNFTGTFHSGIMNDLIHALTAQISGTVRWRENMETLKQHPEFTPVLEVGPDRPLRGFFKAAGLMISSVIDVRTAERAFPKRPVGVMGQLTEVL